MEKVFIFVGDTIYGITDADSEVCKFVECNVTELFRGG